MPAALGVVHPMAAGIICTTSRHKPIGELKLNAKVGNETCQTCQVAARAGCTLHQIATALFRSDPEKPSVIEGTSRGEAGDGI